MKFGIVVFPGSNCDHDCYYAVKEVLKQPAEFVWHGESRPPAVDVYVLPGGFSYGDYLRTGAVARFSPAMEAVRTHAAAGKPVIGICNGFQILLEAGLLPGAMLRNQSLQFVCKYTHLRMDSTRTPFTGRVAQGKVLRLPVAHGEGNYYCDDATLKRLRSEQRIVFRYCDAAGNPTPEANLNGSRDNIAGICSERGNVLGMMPHPERAMEPSMGSTDGRELFFSLLATALVRRR
ncbi:MAG: phosphoribosylformylglycinamidine synthase subunit PurQ [Candidatus Firestonebacteria bacterium]|nr:phosphoribosylformylglycinamidine synthase subunit PurQ [Candidatus Firestonebacteria bacterium]